jgi:hypothetical protein
MITAVNWLNLTTPTGLLVARACGCRPQRRGPYWEAIGYRRSFPVAGAFTIGSVVISRHRLPPAVWHHEVGHIRQYAWCGPMFLPLYGLAAGWSWLRTGDWWSRNVFERRAGLAAGGYVERPLRAWRRPRRGGTAVAAGGA